MSCTDPAATSQCPWCPLVACSAGSMSSRRIPGWIGLRPLVHRRSVSPPCASRWIPKWEIVIVCPLVRLGLTILKFSYLLVRHRKWLYTRLNKVTLCFCFGGSRQSLKVREVKCIPGDPAITCPVLFKGSCSPLSLA